MAITFQRERARDAARDMMPLMRMHYAEIAHYLDIPFDPDLEQYYAMDDAGMLRVFTAREYEQLVGYCVFFVKPNMHYRSSLQAYQDILFVHPDNRKATLGYRLISYCDNALKAEGVQVVYQHVKQAHNFGPLLEHIGYELVDLIYARRLDYGS